MLDSRVAPSELPPVLLFHGVIDSSITWQAAGANHGLAYLLLEAGYPKSFLV